MLGAARAGYAAPPASLPRPPAELPVLPPPGPHDTPPQAPPALPDLTILFISRTPRYHSYTVDYPGGIPILRPGTEDRQRKPRPGEMVTLTAWVKNQGTVAASPTDYRWTLDGAMVEAGPLPALNAGETITLTITWPWKEERHLFELVVDTANTLAETCEANNRRPHVTDALFLAIAVHPYVYDAFAHRPNLVGSWSFEDWVHAQVEQMNQRLGAAVYPLTPAGVYDRVRIDQITLLDPTRETKTVQDEPEFDGRWAFLVAEDDHHTPEDEGLLFAEEYAERYAGQIDWGLIHELTHQLGVIDLYRLSLDPLIGNPLFAADGRPLLLGHGWRNPGLMGGGDTAPYNDRTYYSSHTARGLNSHAGYRRGYYGDYLFDVPARIVLRVLDNRHQPAAGARLDLFQTDGDFLVPEPVISGVTDETGVFSLPNRSFHGEGLTTATGHTLRANPFGLIDVVGTNGLLLARISSGPWPWGSAGPAHEEYRWIELTELNLAYWAGHTDVYTITWATRYPPPDAPAAPVLFGDVERDVVRLHWLPIVGTPPVTYRVYRAVGPEYMFERLADVGDATSYTATLDETSWFVVTAIDGRGLESAFSPTFRACRLERPVDIVIDPATHEETILDQHFGALFSRQSDGDWIGRRGSEHLALVGARSLSLGPGRLTAVAAGGRRVAVLTPERMLVSQFHLGTDKVNPSAYPEGVLIAGPVPDLADPPADDEHALFLARFDGSLLSHGRPPAMASNWAFVPGRFGSAVRLEADGFLAYAETPASSDSGFPATPLLLPEQGGLEFWLRPHWPGRDGADHVLVDAGDGETYRFLLVKDAGGGLYVWVEDYGLHHASAATEVRDWQAESWHHLAVTWNAERLALSVDGRLRDTHTWRHPITGTVGMLWIGADREGQHNADADYDEFRISDFARWDKTDQGRLIVANAGQDRLHVYDLLGNLLSVFGESGGAPGQFRQPAYLTWLDPFQRDALLVVDRGNGRIQRLRFDGHTLSEPAVLADGFGEPAAIAIGPQSTLLVSDLASDTVSLLNSSGELIQVWTEPNDGHAGRFDNPRGMAVRPDGSVLIADSGKGRVVAISGVFPRHAYLPVMTRAAP